MQCSTCGTQLSVGMAFCPTCGNVTPYHTSSSGASPSDATFVSSYEASPSNETAPSYAEVSANPYPSNPYTTPTPPPPPRPRRLSTRSIAVLMILVLLILGTGGVLYFRTTPSSGQVPPHATSTTQAQQATATPHATPTPQAQQATAAPSSSLTPQDLYAQVTQGTPALDTPLSANDTSNWAESSTVDGSCAFTGGAYHASAHAQNSYQLCVAQGTNFGDLAYQVQMTIVKGELGGMVFRTDASQSKYYTFFIDRTATYTLITSIDNTGNNDRTLRKGTSASIKTSPGQPNLLTVIARGSMIYVYINQQYITSASDNTYHSGQIGVFGGDYTQAPADVAFSHLQVWKL